jgi:hypothetical protein
MMTTNTTEESLPTTSTLPRRTETVKFLYLRDTHSKRVVTVARKVSFDTGLITYAYSVSNPLDMFKKELGRKISTGRLEAHPTVIPFNMNNKERPVELVIKDMLSRADSRTMQRILRNGLN